MRTITGAALVLVLGSACVPDGFSYGTGGAAGSGECTDDACGDAAMQCADPWNGVLEEWRAAAITVDADGERVLVAGSTAADGRDPEAAVAAIGRCHGELAKLVPVSQAVSPSIATGVTLFGETLYVSVSEATEGAPPAAAVAALMGSDLTLRDRLPIAPSEGAALARIAASAGHVWAVGQSGSSGVAQPLAIRVGPDQQACSITFGAPPGAARAVAVSAANVFMAGELANAVTVWRFDDAACVAPACGCQAAAVSPPLVPSGASSAQVSDLVAVEGALYVAGAAQRADGSAFGFVLGVDGQTLAQTGALTFDPTTGADAVNALASDGVRVFVGGTSGGTAPDSSGSGQGFFGELVLPLGADGAPAWTTEVAGVASVTALGADTGDGGMLYLGTLGGGGLRRCTKLGACL